MGSRRGSPDHCFGGQRALCHKSCTTDSQAALCTLDLLAEVSEGPCRERPHPQDVCFLHTGEWSPLLL